MQKSVATIVTIGVKNPPKKLEISQFLHRFKALALLFLIEKLDYNIRKYWSIKSCFEVFLPIFQNFILYFEVVTKPTKWPVHPAKTQISLSIRPVWSESSLCAQGITKDPRFLRVNSKDSNQTERMPRLNWIFGGRSHLGGFAILRIILQWWQHRTCRGQLCTSWCVLATVNWWGRLFVWRVIWPPYKSMKTHVSFELLIYA